MSKKKDEILARELGKLGSIGEPGGGIGARLAARHLPDNAFELVIEIDAKSDDVLKAAFNILEQQGRITEEIETTSELPTIYAIVGAGFLNLNPALVSVEVAPISDISTRVSVQGTAKEGLIKQRAGEKAARRVADLLVEMFESS